MGNMFGRGFESHQLHIHRNLKSLQVFEMPGGFFLVRTRDSVVSYNPFDPYPFPAMNTLDEEQIVHSFEKLINNSVRSLLLYHNFSGYFYI